MKKIRIMSGCIGIICVGVIFISVVKYIKMKKIEIDPKKDYFLISEDNTFRDFPYMLGNRLSLLAEDSKMPVAHMGGFCRGFDQFHYSKGYLCYKKTYSSSLLISTMFIDRDRLYVCSLSPKKTIKEIENVDRYVLEGEKLIYEDTKGHLHYYNIKTEEKQEIKVVKFQNPFRVLKINGKSYLSKVKGSGNYIQFKKSKIRLNYKLKPGWKIFATYVEGFKPDTVKNNTTYTLKELSSYIAICAKNKKAERKYL